MKSIKTSAIISHSLNNSPTLDRQIQSVILHTISLVTTKYGFAKIDITEIEKVANTLIDQLYSAQPISRKNLEVYINKFKNYGLSIERDSTIIMTEEFGLQDTEPELTIDKGKLENVLASTIGLHTPTYLMQEMEKANDTLTNLSKSQVQFLSTSKIHDKREISDKLATMINEAKKHVYIMLAFYEEDVSFFANFLSNKVLNSQLDLKIIYNPKDQKNRDFVRKMHDLMQQQNLEFFRIYHPEYITNIGEGRFVGNLHSKAVMTESAVLVGSANLTAMSMYYNIETALYTNDVKAVEEANAFFISLWNRLKTVGAI